MKRIEYAYVYELIGILVAWIREEKCDATKISQYVKYVMIISRSGANHLGFLADEE